MRCRLRQAGAARLQDGIDGKIGKYLIRRVIQREANSLIGATLQVTSFLRQTGFQHVFRRRRLGVQAKFYRPSKAGDGRVIVVRLG